MLVLSRKVGQQIIIGNDIEITIIEIRGEQIRIGIDAPRSVSVHRKELLLDVETQEPSKTATTESQKIDRFVLYGNSGE